MLYAGDVPIDVRNAGFERAAGANEVDGWALDPESTSPSAVLSISQDDPRSGRVSLLLTNDSPATTVAASQPVTLRVGHLYRLSGWIRTKGAQSDGAAKYPTALPACLSMESFPFTNHSPAVGADSDWTQVETMFISTRSQDRVRLHLGHNGKASGQAWFDDIAITKVEDITEYIPAETVRWYGKGYRYDDRGWVFVHVEGRPYERGFQYGALLGDDIVDYITKLALEQNPQDQAAGWNSLRFATDAIFLRGYDEEYMREMRGIADGAAKVGAKYNDRPIDLLDIVTINSVVDLGQLHRALGVTPHALTGESFLEAEQEMDIALEDHKCSAFAATGPATADGSVVFGQIFMWGGYTGVHWNVICDLDPTEGHRLVYHTFPGGIHSGADFYINEAGIVIGETTVSQTPFEPDSTPQSNRIRKAAQYASSIEDVERILWEGNNGMYTNDWPIADVKTGEAAILLLGTQRKKLWRTNEDMSPFGTPGFLWANNNNRDDEVRKEYVAQPDDRPFDLVFSPWNRDLAFNEFYRQYKGRIDSNVAVKMWASSPINRSHACDGKITTTEMAREMAFLAHYGKVTLREKFPKGTGRIMPDLPHAIPHLSLGYSVASPVFITDKLKEAREAGRFDAPDKPNELELTLGDLAGEFKIERKRLWRRTVYPATEAEHWFVSASAAYWELLEALDVEEKEQEKAVEKFGTALADLNCRYLYTVSREQDGPATTAGRAYDRYGPYQIPRIKGTFALHQLRLAMGNESFVKLMRDVHDRYAESSMTNEQFFGIVRAHAGDSAVALLRQWIDRTGLPEIRIDSKLRKVNDESYALDLNVLQGGTPYRFFTHVIVEAGGERHVRRVECSGEESIISLSFRDRPTAVEFNAFHDIPRARPDYYVWRNVLDDFDDLLIAYGTARQDEANHTLARRWQETIADAYIEILPPLVKDSELTGEMVQNHDLMVVGTLDDNYLFRHLHTSLPIRFGRDHFYWRGELFASPQDGIFLVLPNPYNPKHVMYVIAANSALELYEMTKNYTRDIPSWAIFKGDEVVKSGHHLTESVTLGEGPED